MSGQAPGTAASSGAASAGLAAKRCAPCHGGTAPLSEAQARALRDELHPEWKLGPDAKSLQRALKFRDFFRTMSFVNALAHIANVEDHHPDLQIGYNYCNVTFSTHSIGGLSENDFICAAKLDRL
jgi:4a-hydroxytetrahydrobiopterin dehydratase